MLSPAADCLLRNTPQQQEIDRLTARRDALYAREKDLKEQLAGMQEETAEGDGDEETPEEKPQSSGRLRRVGLLLRLSLIHDSNNGCCCLFLSVALLAAPILLVLLRLPSWC